MKRAGVYICVSGVWLAFAVALPGFSQVQQSPSASDEDAQVQAELELYAHAHPYVDQSPAEIEKSVREMRGFEAVASPEPIPDILVKTGAKADELLRKIPDVISDEVVSETQYNKDRMLRAGAIAFFQKPADNAELMGAIRSVLNPAWPGTRAMAPS